MLDEYKNEQKIAYQIMDNAIKKDKVSHAYLLEANGYPKKNDFAIAFAKYLLCENHHKKLEEQKNCPLCSRSVENILDIKIIKPEGLTIKKEQLSNLQEEFSKKPLEGTKKIYIIEEADKLNASSSNALLKFLEEPEENIIAILVVDNMYQLLNTIISRCQIINLQNNKLDEITNTEKKVEYLLGISEVSTYIQTVLSFVEALEKTGESVHLKIDQLWFSVFNTKETMLYGIEILIYFYKDVLNACIGTELEIFLDNIKEIEESKKKNTKEQLYKKINLFLQAKERLQYNCNLNLVMDTLIQKLGEMKA